MESVYISTLCIAGNFRGSYFVDLKASMKIFCVKFRGIIVLVRQDSKSCLILNHKAFSNEKVTRQTAPFCTVHIKNN